MKPQGSECARTAAGSRLQHLTLGVGPATLTPHAPACLPPSCPPGAFTMPSFIPSRFALFALFLLSAAGLATVPVGEKSTSPIVTTFSGHTESVYGVAVNADGTMVATASGDKTIRLFEAATGKELRTYAGAQGHQRMV